MQRTVFFISDGTAITTETLGHSLLTQFDGQAFRQVTLPFISTVDKAQEAVRRINATAEAEGVRPVIFSTLVQEDLREIIKLQANGLFLDFFDAFLGIAVAPVCEVPGAAAQVLRTNLSMSQKAGIRDHADPNYRSPRRCRA